MATTRIRRLGVFLLLALVMASTRIHLSLLGHDVRDASWAVFFLAGFWLRGSARWAFPLLMAEAVLVDYGVIHSQGLDFWSHYCISAAYWALIPAYACLWWGGSWLKRHQHGLRPATVGLAAIAVVASELACYVLSNGSFYWLSASVPSSRSIAGWMVNLGDWYLPFLGTMALYVAIGLLAHALVAQAARLSGHVRGMSRPAER